jgi:hypothetical protein
MTSYFEKSSILMYGKGKKGRYRIRSETVTTIMIILRLFDVNTDY